MIIHSNISPLPFYASLEQQHHRRSYTYGQVLPVIFEKDKILPFQFVIDTEIEPFNSDFNSDFVKGPTLGILGAQVVSLTGGSVNVTSAMLYRDQLTAHRITDSGSLILVRYTGAPNITLPEGPCYLVLSIDGVGVIYSDVFMTCDDVSEHLKLEYRNSYDLFMAGGYIDFSDNFTFKCYIDAELGKPEYSFEEEATARMGYTFIESQVSKKIHRFTFPGTEETCDALRIVRLCNQKKIESKHKTYVPITFSMSANWDDQGDIAAIDCEFEIDNIIQNIGNIKT
jgi:hypothetical protein